MSTPDDDGTDDLVGDVVAEIARTHGIAISRDDPIIAAVLLNRAILRRYLEKALGPSVAAIREATSESVGQIEQLAAAQARWLEQVSLKDRASFLDEQKALHAAWKADLETLIEGQSGALQQAVAHAASRLRAFGAAPATVSTFPTPAAPVAPHGARLRATPLEPGRWIVMGMLLGSSAMAIAGTGAWVWFHVAGR